MTNCRQHGSFNRTCYDAISGLTMKGLGMETDELCGHIKELQGDMYIPIDKCITLSDRYYGISTHPTGLTMLPSPESELRWLIVNLRIAADRLETLGLDSGVLEAKDEKT